MSIVKSSIHVCLIIPSCAVTVSTILHRAKISTKLILGSFLFSTNTFCLISVLLHPWIPVFEYHEYPWHNQLHQAFSIGSNISRRIGLYAVLPMGFFRFSYISTTNLFRPSSKTSTAPSLRSGSRKILSWRSEDTSAKDQNQSNRLRLPETPKTPKRWLDFKVTSPIPPSLVPSCHTVEFWPFPFGYPIRCRKTSGLLLVSHNI